MDDIKLFDGQHNLLPIDSGIPKKFHAYRIPDSTGYHVKVNDNGYMLFQHITGVSWNIWISHYLFTKNTTIYCEGSMEGVEFHNILEGNALYKNGNEEWQHLREGDHNVLYNHTVQSVSKFTAVPVITFDVHMTIPAFKKLIANQPAFREWIPYFSSGINTRLYQKAGSRNVPLQAIIMKIIDKCKQASFDSDGNGQLLKQFLDSILDNKSINCIYKYSFEDIRRLLKAKERLAADPGTKIKITDLYKEALMGHKKFVEGFKLMFGVLPSVYGLQEKIKVCKSLMLQQKDLTNDDYAMIMNFNTGSHFARTFKKVEGMTPKDFREKYGIPKDPVKSKENGRRKANGKRQKTL